MRNKIIDKIKKILAKADPDANNFEAEIEQAAAIAKKLIAEHKITEAELAAHDSLNKDGFAEKEACFGKLSIWMECLVSVVEKITVTQAVLQHRESDPDNKRVVFIGTPSAANLAVELYNNLTGSIDHRANKQADILDSIKGVDLFAALRRAAVNQSYTPADRAQLFDSYAQGFVHKLWERAEEKIKMKTPAEQQKYDLLVIEETKALKEFIQKKFAANDPPRHKLDVDPGAYAQGYRDAETASLNVDKAIK